MNFGWINCDRFYNDPNPKTNIELIVSDDSLKGARFFAVFTDIKSIISTNYWNEGSDTVRFRNIPQDKELSIVGLTVKKGVPYIFESRVNTSEDQLIPVSFTASTHKDIRQRMVKFN